MTAESAIFTLVEEGLFNIFTLSTTTSTTGFISLSLPVTEASTEIVPDLISLSFNNPIWPAAVKSPFISILSVLRCKSVVESFFIVPLAFNAWDKTVNPIFFILTVSPEKSISALILSIRIL